MFIVLFVHMLIKTQFCFCKAFNICVLKHKYVGFSALLIQDISLCIFNFRCDIHVLCFKYSDFIFTQKKGVKDKIKIKKKTVTITKK